MTVSPTFKERSISCTVVFLFHPFLHLSLIISLYSSTDSNLTSSFPSIAWVTFNSTLWPKISIGMMNLFPLPTSMLLLQSKFMNSRTFSILTHMMVCCPKNVFPWSLVTWINMIVVALFYPCFILSHVIFPYNSFCLYPHIIFITCSSIPLFDPNQTLESQVYFT